MLLLALVKRAFLEVVVTVKMKVIPANLILVSCSSTTIKQQGARPVEKTGANDKRQITPALCSVAVSWEIFLPLQQLIYTIKVHGATHALIFHQGGTEYIH